MLPFIPLDDDTPILDVHAEGVGALLASVNDEPADAEPVTALAA